MKQATSALKFSVATRFLRVCESTENRSPDTSATGLYAYDLRDCDDCSGDPCEVKSFVLVNHWGTVIVKEPIEGADDGVELDENDYNYLGENMTLEEFANSALTAEHSASTMEQSM